MKSKAVVFCVVVGVLGIISAIVGFVGEATTLKDSEVSIRIIGDIVYCVSPFREIRILPILGIVLAIITQIYISITFGGCKYFRYDPNSTTKSKFLLICSWIATVLAVTQFSRAVQGSKHRPYHVSDGFYRCHTVKPGTFVAGAILALFSAIFGIAAYVTGIGAPQTTKDPPVVGIPMGANFDPERNAVPTPTHQYPPP